LNSPYEKRLPPYKMKKSKKKKRSVKAKQTKPLKISEMIINYAGWD
jgi:hypothetical protein